MTHMLDTYFVKLSIVFLLVAGCATMSEARKERYERNYIADIENVAEEALLAFQRSGLKVEDSGWSKSKSTYQILGYIQIPASQVRSMVGRTEGTINIAKVDMKLTRMGDDIVHTIIDTSTQGTHAMASSADGNQTAGNPEEDIYDILDKKFTRQANETTKED